MSIPTNRMSYSDIYEIFDKAMDDPAGIRIPFETQALARHYQMRMHNARAIDRRENKDIHKPGDPLYGQSVYDTLQIRIRLAEDGTFFIYVEPKSKLVPMDEIESLSELEE